MTLRDAVHQLARRAGGRVMFVDSTLPVEDEATWFECVFDGVGTEDRRTHIVVRRATEDDALTEMLPALAALTIADAANERDAALARVIALFGDALRVIEHYPSAPAWIRDKAAEALGKERAALAGDIYAQVKPVCVRCGAPYAATGSCSRRFEGCQGGIGENGEIG